jgi:hydrogenase expression/formation protein HypC
MCLAVPARIVSTSGDDPLTREARVDFGGIVRHVSLALLPEARIGDYVLVHVGFAISVLDEAEAGRVLATLAQIGEPVP